MPSMRAALILGFCEKQSARKVSASVIQIFAHGRQDDRKCKNCFAHSCAFSSAPYKKTYGNERISVTSTFVFIILLRCRFRHKRHSLRSKTLLHLLRDIRHKLTFCTCYTERNNQKRNQALILRFLHIHTFV